MDVVRERVDVSSTAKHIAEIVYVLYGQILKYDKKNKIWYEFNPSRNYWYETLDDSRIRVLLSTDVANYFTNRSIYWINQAGNDMENPNLLIRSQRLRDISAKLKNSRFKDDIIKICQEDFFGTTDFIQTCEKETDNM